jgi:hypothetical protein
MFRTVALMSSAGVFPLGAATVCSAAKTTAGLDS